MKKNGFTLVEMICVIVLLTILITLSIGGIVNNITETRKKQNDATLKLVFSATNEYIQKYEDNYEKNNNVLYCVKIQDLIDDGILINTLQYNGTQLDKNEYVSITYLNSKFVYELKQECSETKKYILNNLVKNGGFENGSDNWSLTNAQVVQTDYYSGTSSLKFLVQSSVSSSQVLDYNSPILNHKYYGVLLYKTSDNFTSNDAKFEWYNADATDARMIFGQKENTSSWVKMSDIKVISNSDYLNDDWILKNYVSGGSSISYVDNIMVIDLTESFGSGNEPTKQWLDENLSYFENSTAIYK